MSDNLQGSSTGSVDTAHRQRPEICPRCEDAILVGIEVPHDVTLSGSVVRIPRVRMEECPVCGFRTLSGREVRLIEVLFAPHYEHISDLVAALRAARYHGMFLREDQSETGLGFGLPANVDRLAAELRDLYLDNEASHVLDGLQAPGGVVALDVAGHHYRLKLPKIGEGENGTVFDREEHPGTVFKVAKPRPYCRNHVLEEAEVTGFFAGKGIPVPEIVEADRHGRFVIKKRLGGLSLAVLYGRLGDPDTPRHHRVRDAVREFVDRLLDLFVRHPSAKVSVSPNNIFVVETGDRCECLLVDTGLAPFHDYSAFDFEEYWNVVIPQKIRRYREVGYIGSGGGDPGRGAAPHA